MCPITLLARSGILSSLLVGSPYLRPDSPQLPMPLTAIPLPQFYPTIKVSFLKCKSDLCQNASVTFCCLQNKIQILLTICKAFMIWTLLCVPSSSLTALSSPSQIPAIINYLQFLSLVFLYFYLEHSSHFYSPGEFPFVLNSCLYKELFLTSSDVILNTLPKCSYLLVL